MHFGRKLLAQRHEPWKAHYIDYETLKTLLEGSTDASSHRRAVSPQFLNLLNKEVDRCVHFFLQEQGQISEELCKLQPRLSEANTIEKWFTLYEQYKQQAVLTLYLVHFVDLNVTGIRKILKKHDKVTGHKLSPVYLHPARTYFTQQPQAVLRPLLEDGGLEALYVSLEQAFDILYALKRTLHPTMERWNTWSDDDMGRLESGDAKDSIQNQRASSSERPLERYDSIPAIKHHEMALLLKIEHARRRLRQTSEFVHMLAAQLVLEEPSEDRESLRGAPPAPSKVRRISNYLNFCSTFLHMTDYYIVAPTSGVYAARLGGATSLAGLIIGLNSVAALVSTILYSWWTSYHYKSALIFASSCQLTGCVIYALALPMNSINMIYVGRLVGGFGSARSINRRYIADTYPPAERTAASAGFVTAGALGTSVGPAAAALLYLFVPKSSTNPWWQIENAPGFTMAVLWSVYVCMLVIYFKDPPRPHRQAPRSKETEVSAKSEETQNLLASNGSFVEDPKNDIPLWKSVPVCTTFVVYFTLKFILESLLSSTAILTDYYFGWKGSSSGIYMAILGLLVLPANWLIAVASQVNDDRNLILYCEGFMFLGCLAILQYTGTYTQPQYLLGSILIFVSTNSLEGPNMSLLSKTIPPRYRTGLFNVGLLATESGTLGRAVGDVILTMCGAQGMGHVLNKAFGMMAALSLGTIGLTWCVFDKLQESDD